MAIQDKVSFETCKKIKRNIEPNFEIILLIKNIIFLKEEKNEQPMRVLSIPIWSVHVLYSKGFMFFNR